ncbi:hypothetical protein Pmani_035610 [Petrolisthes manimaculis]|uniref:Uncharacterized protein n=1 Tax=Petrolisthes manimaculis TaxID=1843537 RepID=A0AAE1NML2_9EUCA|nr:hypothetical protein Pmani_035610 [Petrolisthes manimaculis]
MYNVTVAYYDDVSNQPSSQSTKKATKLTKPRSSHPATTSPPDPIIIRQAENAASTPETPISAPSTSPIHCRRR